PIDPLSAQFSPNILNLAADRAFIRPAIRAAGVGIEPILHRADQLGLRLRKALIVDALAKRNIEAIPIMLRWPAWAAPPDSRRRGAGREQFVLRFEAINFLACQQNVPRRDHHAFRRFGYPCPIIILIFADAADGNRARPRTVATEHGENV